MISLVLAMADNGVIGSGDKLPWRLAEDMRRFKAITLGKPIVMGRKTWESLPKKPLPGRTNIVVSRDCSFAADGAIVVHALDEALARAEQAQPEEIMVVGGAEIFLAALPRADRIHLTEVHMDADGDVSMPTFDAETWLEIEREEHVTDSGLCYSYVTLERRPPSP